MEGQGLFAHSPLFTHIFILTVFLDGAEEGGQGSYYNTVQFYSYSILIQLNYGCQLQVVA